MPGQNERPNFPTDGITPNLVALIHRCWARAAVDRPSFEEISLETTNLIEQRTEATDATPRPHLRPEIEEEENDDSRSENTEGGDGARSPFLEPTERLEGASKFHPLFQAAAVK